VWRSQSPESGVARSRPTILTSKTYDRADDLNIHILSSPTFLLPADNWTWTSATVGSLFVILVYYSLTQTQSLLTHQPNSQLLRFYKLTLQSRGQDLCLRNPPSPDHKQHSISCIPTQTTSMAQTETSINIPQLLAVALVGFFAIRWYLNKPPPSSASGGSGSSASSSRNRAVDPAQITQVSAMFPQLDRRSIAWDLHRNGGNVAGTSERILSGRGLDNPPPSYQPPLPAQAAPSAAQSPRAGAGQTDLITRYGLQGRIGDKGKEAVQSEEQKRMAWTSDKAARAEGLKRRREEMVLEARRKMLEKDAAAA
jgi:coupling of ubiquitin conjugation to ER degradation protein 1